MNGQGVHNLYNLKIYVFIYLFYTNIIISNTLNYDLLSLLKLCLTSTNLLPYQPHPIFGHFKIHYTQHLT
jgi:hypothetical protein